MWYSVIAAGEVELSDGHEAMFAPDDDSERALESPPQDEELALGHPRAATQFLFLLCLGVTTLKTRCLASSLGRIPAGSAKNGFRKRIIK